MGWIVSSDADKAFPYTCPYCGCEHSSEKIVCDRCGKLIKSFKESELIPMEKWREAFARTLAIAIDKDYFDEMDFLFPNGVPLDEDGDEDWGLVWNLVDKAFYEIFGIDRHFLY